jgi:hypothetical protein
MVNRIIGLPNAQDRPNGTLLRADVFSGTISESLRGYYHLRDRPTFW